MFYVITKFVLALIKKPLLVILLKDTLSIPGRENAPFKASLVPTSNVIYLVGGKIFHKKSQEWTGGEYLSLLGRIGGDFF